MIRAKLKDNTGASITYALLLFLVCAVVGSVVLAAGTAAAGRMSQAVENDQRYYAVTSAVRVLREQLDKRSNTIVFTDKNDDRKVTVNSVPSENYTFANDVYLGSYPPNPTSMTDYASAVVAGIVDKPTVSISLTLNPGIDGISNLEVLEDIDLSDPSDPKLYLDVFSTAEEDAPKYMLSLTFTASVEDVVKKKKVREGDSFVETNEVTKKISWNYYDVKNVGQCRATASTG